MNCQQQAGEEASPQENKDEETVKENGVPETEEVKTPDTEGPAMGDQQDETATTPEKSSDEKAEEASDKDKKKEKSKKKKWSFRSISFSKKDKSKPSKENDKNGEVKEVAEEVSDLLLRYIDFITLLLSSVHWYTGGSVGVKPLRRLR